MYFCITKSYIKVIIILYRITVRNNIIVIYVTSTQSKVLLTTSNLWSNELASNKDEAIKSVYERVTYIILYSGGLACLIYK